LLTLEQMVENDYPIPSYMADVFEKPPGWVETPQPADNESKENQKIYAIDCEMVCSGLLLSVTYLPSSSV
jgi:RNA exonuclease 1